MEIERLAIKSSIEFMKILRENIEVCEMNFYLQLRNTEK